jgi:hypothetical protein
VSLHTAFGLLQRTDIGRSDFESGDIHAVLWRHN